MDFERYGEVGFGLDETLDPEPSVLFQPKKLNLNGVD